MTTKNGTKDPAVEEEIVKLKALVYDYMAQQQALQGEINAVNGRIAELARVIPGPES